MAKRSSTLMHAYNLFKNEGHEKRISSDGWYGGGMSGSPDRRRLHISNEQSLIASIYTRIAIDCAMAMMRHVRLDEDGRYIEDMPSGLNECLEVEANIDQTGFALKMDMVLSLCDIGEIAIAPTDVSINPFLSGGYDIKSLRVGQVMSYMPKQVRIEVYNENEGVRQQVVADKKFIGIVQNPLYAVMNETNSTLQRLIRTINRLDAVDESNSSGKLDLIIQLPYVIKSDSKRKQAEQRAIDIETQLRKNKYGIAYTDGTEKITQLNRPAENTLHERVEYLTTMVFQQLGLTPEIMAGTADEAAMLNYQSRTVKPIVKAIIDEMRRKFLTKTARSQGQSMMAFRDPFEFVPMEKLAEIGDKFTRNEIASSNDMRMVVGWKPSKDPKADELRNSNMPDPNAEASTDVGDGAAQSALDAVEASVNTIFADLGIDDDESANS